MRAKYISTNCRELTFPADWAACSSRIDFSNTSKSADCNSATAVGLGICSDHTAADKKSTEAPMRYAERRESRDTRANLNSGATGEFGNLIGGNGDRQRYGTTGRSPKNPYRADRPRNQVVGA